MPHERPVAPFSDLHVEAGHVRATLLHDPSVEGLDMAIYLDGSSSMQDEYRPRTRFNGNFWQRLFGKATSKVLTNQVERQLQWMLEYLATKDRNGLLRVGYWACGKNGRKVEIMGEIKGTDIKHYRFSGPKQLGGDAHLAPAMRDYLEYFRRQVRKGTRRGCAVFLTKRQLRDSQRVKELSEQVAHDIARGRLPRTNFVLIGVGDEVDEAQLEDICHTEYPGVEHLWCHRIAEEIQEVAELGPCWWTRP